MKKIYFTGIKGVGMTPLAILLKEGGCDVAGSDVEGEFITDRALKDKKISAASNFNPENVRKFFKNPTNDSLLIYTAAHHGRDNIEVKEARKLGIKTMSLGKALGKLTKGELFVKKQKIISVAGTHGKTTTAALLAHLMLELGADPSYIIGTSELLPKRAPGHFGKGDHLILESDEYVSDLDNGKVPKFHLQIPDYSLITNIDFDHPDIFKSKEEVKEAFKKYIKNVLKITVANADNQDSIDVVSQSGKKFITFGRDKNADYRYTNIQQEADKTKFDLLYNNEKNSAQLSLSGEHNVSNATAAAALLHTLGYKISQITPHIATFKGSKRRTEKKGKMQSGAQVIDDYAHHPLEIEQTLKGLRKKYHKKILCIFQPHTYSRTQALLDDFVLSFKDVDRLILLPIFTSAREKNNKKLTKEKYTQAFKSANKNTTYLPNHSAVIKYLRKHKFDDKYLVVTMGAGDVYKIADTITNQNHLQVE